MQFAFRGNILLVATNITGNLHVAQAFDYIGYILSGSYSIDIGYCLLTSLELVDIGIP